MNVYMSVDIEGITGVVHRDMMSPGEREYDRGRRLMTADANAAIEGLVQAGADFILVNDGHGPMRNLLFEEMHPAAHLLTGSGEQGGTTQAMEHEMMNHMATRFIDSLHRLGTRINDVSTH